MARTSPANGHADGEDCILYLLEPTQRLWRDAASVQPVAVSTIKARRLRGGAYGREHPLAVSVLTGDDPPPYVALDDQLIGRLLGGGAVQTRRLGSPGDGETLERMLETGPLPLAQRPQPPARPRRDAARAVRLAVRQRGPAAPWCARSTTGPRTSSSWASASPGTST